MNKKSMGEEKQKQENPIISIFQNTMLSLFPEKNHHPKQQSQETSQPQSQSQSQSLSQPPDVVNFTTVIPPPPPLKLVQHSDQTTTTTTSPAVLFQVYALGGFILVKWLWARWNERRNLLPKQDDDEEEEPEPEPTPTPPHH